MFIVCRIHENGTLVASSSPYVHPDEESASNEALRLANTNGSKYVVFGALATTSRPKIPDAVLVKVVPATVFN